MLSLAVAALAVAAQAAPAPQPTPAPAGAPITNSSQWDASLSALSKGPASAFAAGYASLLAAVQPSATPSNEAQIASSLASVARAYPSNPLAAGGALILSGLTGGSEIGNPLQDLEAFGACNGYANVNAPAKTPIYPKKGAKDATYSVPEDSLRAAIYIPPGFTKGAVNPVLFVPGSGVAACETFAINIGKLVAGSKYADPVYVNVPDYLLADEQISSEYIAYAVNYINANYGKNVSLVAWSAGGPVSQWAFKYWPSTRSSVTSFVAISPDYHGSALAPLLCPPGVPCAPAILQQNYPAKWIAQLRKNGGSNSLVPTTEIHSVFDEIVQPQIDPLASAYLGNGGPGVTNVQVQNICAPGTFAGGPNFGHENLLYNPVSVALALDALKNGGVADVKRAGPYNCSSIKANGLSYSDVFASEFLIPLSGFNIETFQPRVTSEPPTASYATF